MGRRCFGCADAEGLSGTKAPIRRHAGSRLIGIQGVPLNISRPGSPIIRLSVDVTNAGWPIAAAARGSLYKDRGPLPRISAACSTLRALYVANSDGTDSRQFAAASTSSFRPETACSIAHNNNPVGIARWLRPSKSCLRGVTRRDERIA